VIGLDTNVLVRYLAQDDQTQSALATKLIETLDRDNQGFISVVVLVELHWVLRRAYKLTRSDAVTLLRRLLTAEELVISESEAVHRALARSDGKIDFPDALIVELASAAGCHHTFTFDSAAAELAGMRPVPG